MWSTYKQKQAEAEAICDLQEASRTFLYVSESILQPCAYIVKISIVSLDLFLRPPVIFCPDSGQSFFKSLLNIGLPFHSSMGRIRFQSSEGCIAIPEKDVSPRDRQSPSTKSHVEPLGRATFRSVGQRLAQSRSAEITSGSDFDVWELNQYSASVPKLASQSKT